MALADIKTRTFLIQDIGCEVLVEKVKTIRDIFYYWLEDYIDNLQYDWFDGSDDCFHILYKDGSYDCINEEYDGHKIKRKNIASIVYDNACTSIVYGNFEINEFGVVTTAFEEMIAETNIVEIK